MDGPAFRKAVIDSIDQIINYYDTIEERRVVSDVSPGYLREILPKAAPNDGEQWSEIQKDIEDKIVPGLTHWQSPKFMAFYPASSTYPGMLGELFSAAFTAPAFNWLCSPAMTELETIVLDWLAQILRLPESYLSRGEGGGVIQGSASESTVVAIVAARERFISRACQGLEGKEKESKRAELQSRLVALGTDQSHSSAAKGALIAGVRYRSIHCRTEDDFALTGRAVEGMLQECRQDGLEPFFLLTTLGTTNTCAVDRFAEIKQAVKKAPNLWVHVDAAYAGSALVCEEYQHLAKDFEAFDSFDMNMHKWLLTNFDASCMFVKKRTDLTDALSITPAYLRNDFSSSGLVTDYRDWQIPLGRRFRALKIWFVMRTYGVSGLKAHIRNHIKLGQLFYSLIRTRPDLFKVEAPHAFALTVFSIKPGSNDSEVPNGSVSSNTGVTDGLVKETIPDRVESEQLERANAITKEVYELVNARGEIFITSTVIDGVYAIRVVSANPRAEEKWTRKAFEILVKTAEEVLQRE